MKKQKFELDNEDPIVPAPKPVVQKQASSSNFQLKRDIVGELEEMDEIRMRVTTFADVDTKNPNIFIFQHQLTREMFVLEKTAGIPFILKYLQQYPNEGVLNEYLLNGPVKLVFDLDIKKEKMKEVGIESFKELIVFLKQLTGYLTQCINSFFGRAVEHIAPQTTKENEWFEITVGWNEDQYSVHLSIQPLQFESQKDAMQFKEVFLVFVSSSTEFFQKLFKIMDHGNFPWMKLPYMFKYDGKNGFVRQLCHLNLETGRVDNKVSEFRIRQGLLTWFEPGKKILKVRMTLTPKTIERINEMRGIKKPKAELTRKMEWDTPEEKRNKLETARALSTEEILKYSEQCIRNVKHYFSIAHPSAHINEDGFKRVRYTTDGICIYLALPSLPCPIRPLLIAQGENVPRHEKNGNWSLNFITSPEGELNTMWASCWSDECKKIGKYKQDKSLKGVYTVKCIP